MALGVLIQAVVDRSAGEALMALPLAVFGVPFALFAWIAVLRPSLRLTAEEVVVVNVFGTRRVAVADVVDVTVGLDGPRLRLRDGSSVGVRALADTAGGWPTRGRRAREVKEAIVERQRQVLVDR